jgi:hypothetical protein
MAPFLGPYAAAAITLSYEVARFGIETSVVVPGAFTKGTAHFANAGKPADGVTAAAYSRYDDEITRIVGLPAGTRPSRSVFDFIDDGAGAVTEVAERVREEFAQRIGIADLLKPSIA